MSRAMTPKLGDIALFVKQITGASTRTRVSVRPWASTDDLRAKISTEVLSGKHPPERLRLFCRGQEILSGETLLESVVRRGDLVYVDVVNEEEQTGNGVLLSLHMSDTLMDVEPPQDLVDCLSDAKEGIEAGHAPILAEDGTGGTYFFLDGEKRFVAAFKPGDEEPFCENNPRGYASRDNSDEGMRTGIRPGEAHYREVAAYLLDRDGFVGVPPTTLVEARHTAFSNLSGREDTIRKVGSLQRFVVHDSVVEDGDEKFLPVSEVHRIAMFDIRTLNGDRNNENILVVRNPRLQRQRSASDAASTSGAAADTFGQMAELSEDVSRLRPESQRMNRGTGAGCSSPDRDAWDVRLVPIDHGYCLPERLEIGWCDWTWLEWPQLKLPVSAEDREYILNLDPYEEAKRLEKLLPIRESALRNMVAAGILLREGIRAGLTLYDIANIIARQDLDKPSELERILGFAEDMSQMALRQPVKYGLRPSVRRGQDLESAVDAQSLSNHVEQLCVGLASPAARTMSRRSVGDLQAYPELVAGRPCNPPERKRSSSLHRVMSYGGFSSSSILDTEKRADSPSPPSDPAVPKLVILASASPSPPSNFAAAKPVQPPQPGGSLTRLDAIDGATSLQASDLGIGRTPDGRVVRGGDLLSRIRSEALFAGSSRALDTSFHRFPVPEIEGGDEDVENEHDHYFYGAVKLHVKPLVMRKLRLRRERGFLGIQTDLDGTESIASAPRTPEARISGSSFVSSMVDSVTHTSVWTV
mmetsp:Transcript_13859/g.51724  ORF Transcript_13859/g.51724 Transcript_13859/m.51724 type:complete len:755 (-) Transcript_13859:1299-3563(-)|eukprot:scaffold7381_cov310-Pinguiococcus_pyrenoidosus.AAC.59